MPNLLKTVKSLIILTALPVAASVQIPYPSAPDWTSTDTQVSTGGALADLDGDGWKDLVVANGNDMARQRLVVYFNQGDGTFPDTPDWVSDDVAYNGHLDVADVNGDGWPDVAVAGLGSFDNLEPMVRLYLNNGGILSSLPDWQSSASGNAFGCAFGDVDNDGRPDLAVATGWAYDPQNSYQNLVFINSGGAYPTTASWVSDDDDHLMGVTWADTDRDGWLDLIGAASLAQTRIYRNLGGTLETTASWTTVDSSNQTAIMAVTGDLSGNGIDDLMVTDNTQTGGSGRFRQYDGLPAGQFETTYGWSYFDDYGSAATLADVDADGSLDLATGSWWGHTNIFANTGAGLPANPDWSSGSSSVIEKILFADVDRDGLVTASVQSTTEDRLIHLGVQPIEAILSVVLDGTPLLPSEFTFSREYGWVTVGQTPSASVEITFVHSLDLDMAVTNWDSSVGNFLYWNTRQGFLFIDGFESGDTSGWDTTAP